MQIETGEAFSRREVVLGRHPINPEAYPGCLVEAMKLVNRGSSEAKLAVESTVVDPYDSNNFAAVCGRCSITLVKDNGTVYGAKKCSKVQTGEINLGELA